MAPPTVKTKYVNRLLKSRARYVPRPDNPLLDPIGHIKRPLKALNGDRRGQGVVRPGQAVIEFSPCDIQHIRMKFWASQRQFAWLIGVSWETLRNWERGRRRPHGPARALLRAIDADPIALARALNWHARTPQEEPDEWLED